MRRRGAASSFFLGQIARAAWGDRHDPNGLAMAVFRAYYDAAGSQQDPKFMVMQGIVATEKKWARIEDRWNKTLKRRGIKSIHATDFLAGQDPASRNLTSRQRHEVLSGFVAIVTALADFSCHVGLRVSDLKPLADSSSPLIPLMGGNHSRAGACSILGGSCLSQMRDWARGKEIDAIHHVFEDGDFGLAALFDSIKGRHREYGQTVTKQEKTDPKSGLPYVHFQAVDAIAWYSRAYYQKMQRASLDDVVVKSRAIRLMHEWPNKRFGYHSPETLQQWDGIARLLKSMLPSGDQPSESSSPSSEA